MTTSRPVAMTGALLVVVLDVALVVAPSVLLAGVARTGALATADGLDLFAASAVVGAVQATIAWRRLRHETTVAERLVDVWIAAFDSLVVLAAGAIFLLLFVLGGFAEQHGTVLNEGWPILGVWIGIQVLTVSLAELSGHRVLRWLEPRRPPAGADPPRASTRAGPSPTGRARSSGRNATAPRPVGGS